MFKYIYIKYIICSNIHQIFNDRYASQIKNFVVKFGHILKSLFSMKRGEKRIKAYFERKSEVYEEVLDFLQSDEDIIIKFDNLCKLFSDQKVGNEPEELNHFLLMLLSISNNNHRKHGFFKKIEHILVFFKSDIKRTYSNFDLFKMFLSNKRILLFLFENDFIKFEEEFVKYFYDLPHYCHFFYPEIHEFISDEKSKLILEEMHEINPRY